MSEETNPNSTPAVGNNPGTKYPFASVTLSDEQLSSVINKVNELKGILPPMPDLTPKERQRMSKLGSKSRGFADLAIETAKADPGVLPQSISLDTFLAQDELLRDLSLVQTHVADLKSVSGHLKMHHLWSLQSAPPRTGVCLAHFWR